MAFVVVNDACVLYPSVVRDFLIRVAAERTVRAHWTELILDEVFTHLKENRKDLDPVKLDRTRALMNEALEDPIVTGFEPLISALTLPDPDDRHVLAAAIKAGAQVIVTFNLKDFPAEVLGPFGIEAKGPDDFLIDQFHIDDGVLRSIVRDIAATWNAHRGSKQVTTADDVLRQLETAGLVQLAAVLRE